MFSGTPRFKINDITVTISRFIQKKKLCKYEQPNQKTDKFYKNILREQNVEIKHALKVQLFCDLGSSQYNLLWNILETYDWHQRQILYEHQKCGATLSDPFLPKNTRFLFLF